MAAGRESGLKDQQPTFRWYHLPANNMEWVQDLLRRHLSGNDDAPVPLSDDYQAKMRLLRSSGETSLFMRPGCHTAKIHPDGSPGDGGIEQIVSVVPFLHYETLRGMQAMSNALVTRGQNFRPAGHFNHHARPGGVLAWMAGGSKPAKKKKKTKTEVGDGHSADTPAPPVSRPGGSIPLRPGHRGFSLPPPPPPGRGLPWPSQPPPPGRPMMTRGGPPAGHPRALQYDPHWHLLRGYYLGPGVYGHAPPLQLRRTLDKYFYTHLQIDDPRNVDQVVTRATHEAPSPMLFVVDQLWIWIVNGDTIITCLPTVWHHRLETHLPPPPPAFANPLETTQGVHPQHPHAGNQAQGRVHMSVLADPLDVHQNLLRYLRTTRRAPLTTAHELADLVTNFCVNVFDPYQVPEHLQFFYFFERSLGIVADQAAQRFQKFRHSASSVDIARRIARSNLSIGPETDLLIEIEDIHDELSILQMVLQDQRETTQNLNRVLGRHSKQAADPYSIDYGTLENNRILEGHLSGIKKMMAIAKKTSKMLYALLDLKQKQASIIEAYAAREQADIAAGHAEREADQAAQTRIQAEESVKQGKTVLLFTVVTVIFLPLSFMAAFFTINIEAFPVNENKNLELGYVLKYMLSISAGLSVPFIIVIFNQERVWLWLGFLRQTILRLPTMVWVSLIGMGAALAVIWTTSLVWAIRIALTICTIIIGLMAIGLVALQEWWASRNEERRTRILEKVYMLAGEFFGSGRRRRTSRDSESSSI
ncbi:hypothetical protein B0H67DRAFT_387126 [Lasiosphaeris hirsuta]|uniref:Ankyrin repeat protein n=1 Tax=Lasiosphaeris hirsuta TaxID=260670 RepID=A0AA39ZXQ3_9PEZI|nr:hypothetical protein B0H67DRAFT_387126 [Lasiosphaeris hirsuta]